MDDRVVLHDLPGEKRARELVKLIETLYQGGRRIVVWVADEGRRQMLDDYLWTYEKLAFVPHTTWTHSQGDLDEPVVLVGEEANPNRATALLVGDDVPPMEWAASFAEIHDFVPSGAAGDERRQRWADAFGGG